MGYAAEKRKVEKKMKVLKRVLLCILIFLVGAALLLASFVPPRSWKYYVSLPDIGKRKAGEMRIHFLDVGQGDCTLIELPDGKTMLIDGGEQSARSEKSLLRYLNALKIKTVDHLVITHTDGDHCGALKEMLSYKKVVNAYLPATDSDLNGEYAEVYAELMKKSVACQTASRRITLSVTNGAYPYTLTFLAPYTLDAETQTGENESSSVVWLDYKGVSALFTGDAPIATEELLMRDDDWGLLTDRGVELSDTEILKVAHHGGNGSTSAEFLEYLGVETAVISCGENNAYGHPKQETLDRLIDANAKVYRTDRDGHIVITVSADGAYTARTV